MRKQHTTGINPFTGGDRTHEAICRRADDAARTVRDTQLAAARAEFRIVQRAYIAADAATRLTMTAQAQAAVEKFSLAEEAIMNTFEATMRVNNAQRAQA